LGLTLMAALAGCSWFDETPEKPLEGERKPVLQQADETAAGNAAAPNLAPPRAVTAWPQENASAVQIGVHANFTPTFEQVWDTPIGDGEDGRRIFTARPVAAEGKIFAMDTSGNVSSLDAVTGKTLWHVSTRRRGEALAGGMAVNNSVLYLTNGLAQVMALSTQNGALLWHTDLDSPTRTAPTVSDGKVYAVTRGDQVYALNAATGKILWQDHGLQELAGVIAGAAPAADSDMVIVAYVSGELTALSPGNGSVLWNDNLAVGRPENNLATLHDFRTPPALLNDMVLAANFASNTVGVERRLGDRIWGQNFGALQPITVSGDTIFMISTNAQLVALARDTGTKLWSQALPPPLPKDNDDEPDEDELRHQRYWYGPLLMNGQLFVISETGTAQLRDAKTGNVIKEVKELPIPAENPIILNNMIYWVTTEGELVAYR